MERSSFRARVGIFPFIDNMIKVLFPICTSTWRVKTMFPAKEKV